jgi:hypothetical protein
MQGRLPVRRSLLLKCIINMYTYIDCLQEPGMSLSCSKLLKMQSKWQSTLTLNRHIASCSKTTSGQNTEYHLLCAWTSSTSHNKQNVSILSTHDDNRFHVTISLFDHIAQYTSFSYVTRPLPVKRYFRSKHGISSFMRMNLFYKSQKNRISLSCLHLVIIGDHTGIWPNFAKYALQLCYATISGKMTLPVKTAYIIFCSYRYLLYYAKTRICLACSQRIKFGFKWPYPHFRDFDISAP